MNGWIIPPPKEPAKTREDFRRERGEKVRWLIRHGYLRSERIKKALLTVPREDFIPYLYLVLGRDRSVCVGDKTGLHATGFQGRGYP